MKVSTSLFILLFLSIYLTNPSDPLFDKGDLVLLWADQKNAKEESSQKVDQGMSEEKLAPPVEEMKKGEVKIVEKSISELATTLNDENYLSFYQLAKTKLDLQKLPPEYPDTVERFDEKSVTILGFILPLDQLAYAKHFLLMKHPRTCYYCGGNPTLTDLVFIKLEKGQTMSYTPELIKVSGDFKLLRGSTPFQDREQKYENMLLFSVLNADVSEATKEDREAYLKGISHEIK